MINLKNLDKELVNTKGHNGPLLPARLATGSFYSWHFPSSQQGVSCSKCYINEYNSFFACCSVSQRKRWTISLYLYQNSAQLPVFILSATSHIARWNSHTVHLWIWEQCALLRVCFHFGTSLSQSSAIDFHDLFMHFLVLHLGTEWNMSTC